MGVDGGGRGYSGGKTGREIFLDGVVFYILEIEDVGGWNFRLVLFFGICT